MKTYVNKQIHSPVNLKLESDSTSQDGFLSAAQKDQRSPLVTEPVSSVKSFDCESGPFLDTSLAAEHSAEKFESPEFHWSEYKHLSSSYVNQVFFTTTMQIKHEA